MLLIEQLETDLAEWMETYRLEGKDPYRLVAMVLADKYLRLKDDLEWRDKYGRTCPGVTRVAGG